MADIYREETELAIGFQDPRQYRAASGWISGYGNKRNYSYINHGSRLSHCPILCGCLPKLILSTLQAGAYTSEHNHYVLP